MTRVARLANLRDRIPTLRMVLPRPAPLQNVERTRGWKWTQIRRRQLQREPLCRVCKARGLIVAADEVDHIVPLMNGGTDADSNLQSLCIPDHRAKTDAEIRERDAARVA